jgi:hypothetical protein
MGFCTGWDPDQIFQAARAPSSVASMIRRGWTASPARAWGMPSLSQMPSSSCLGKGLRQRPPGLPVKSCVLHLDVDGHKSFPIMVTAPPKTRAQPASLKPAVEHVAVGGELGHR